MGTVGDDEIPRHKVTVQDTGSDNRCKWSSRPGSKPSGGPETNEEKVGEVHRDGLQVRDACCGVEFLNKYSVCYISTMDVTGIGNPAVV